MTLSIAAEGLDPGEHGWHLHAMGMCDPSSLEPFVTAGSLLVSDDSNGVIYQVSYGG